MATYARTTDVSPEKSRAEIEATLRRYGCTAFMAGWDEERGLNVISFRLHGRMARLNVPMPDVSDPAQRKRLRESAVASRASRQPEALERQAVRQRWRAVVLYVKALCEAIESGLVTAEQAFLPFLVLPNNMTVSEWAGPQLEALLAGDGMPPLLPGAH